MMMAGIIASLVVSSGWVVGMNAYMHFRPSDRRFNTSLFWWLLSMPCVYFAYRALQGSLGPIGSTTVEASGNMGLFFAYFTHILLFILYSELFYYIERSVTLRIFVEILNHRGPLPRLKDIQRRYHVEEMILRRLDVLKSRHFIDQQEGKWSLKVKGEIIAVFTEFALWLFHAKGPQDRC